MRARRKLSGAAEGGVAQKGAKEALRLEAEEATRGVERRAERHAATRFVACAAEHVARRGGRIRPTKHRGAKRREGDGNVGAGSGVSPKREARAAKRALCGVRGRGRSLARRTPEVPWAASFAAASRAHRSRSRRDAQDCDPKAYMHTPSGRMDAHAARAAQGVRLRRNLPCADRQGQSDRPEARLRS